MNSRPRTGRTRPSKTSVLEQGRLAPDLDLIMTQLATTLRVAVIFGGNKATPGAVLRASHNPRSWKSYEAVANNIADGLGRIGFSDVVVLPDDMRLAAELERRRINMAWINSGGVQGRNAIAHTASLLEMLGIPYVGHDPLTAALLDSKHHFKRQLMALQIPTAPFFVVEPNEALRAAFSNRRLSALLGKWQDGFIVKPVSGRASLHVHFVERAADLSKVAEHVLECTQNSVLIEAYLPGREYCIAVCGPVVSQRGKLRRLSRPFAFSGVERQLGRNENIFTSMDVAPITTSRARALHREQDSNVLKPLEAIARKVYTETPLQTLVRLDIRADAKGKLFVLEANPKPDLAAPTAKSTSLICAGLDGYGMTYDDLIRSVFFDRAATLFDQRVGSVEQFFRSFQCANVGRRH